MRRLALPFALGVLLAAAAAHAQDGDAPTVTIRAERGKAQLGESFHVWVTVIHPPGMTITLPTNSELGGGIFGVLHRDETSADEQDGTVRTVFDLTIAGFDLGKQEFPAFTVGYEVNQEQRGIRTDPLPIEILSVVADGKEELRPIAPPVSIYERDWLPAWIGGGLVVAALLVAAGWFLAGRVRRRRRARLAPEEAARLLPPDEAALLRLRALEASGQLDAEDVRPVFFTLTEIVREYLGRRHGFDALELTTAELEEALERRGIAQRAAIMAFLADCDLVKFARIPVTPTEARAALERAVGLVNADQPAQAPAATPPAEPPPAEQPADPPPTEASA